MLSVLTFTQLTRIFEHRRNYDLRKLLAGIMYKCCSIYVIPSGCLEILFASYTIWNIILQVVIKMVEYLTILDILKGSIVLPFVRLSVCLSGCISIDPFIFVQIVYYFV